MRRLLLILSLFTSLFVPGLQSLASKDYPRPLKLEELTTEQQELMRKAMSLATPLTEERITYHYGKPAPCEKLVQSGTYTGEVYAKYSRLSEKGGAVAGHGVYIAGNPHSSITYFAGGGVQVVLAPGTPVIDVTDSGVQRRMHELGLTNSDIYNLPLDAVVRYSEGSDWFVVKGATGVRFEPIDFSRMSDADFSRFMEGIRFSIAVDEVPQDLRASILARLNVPSPDRGKHAARWFFSDSSTNLERFGELSAEARRDALDWLRAQGKLANFFEEFPFDLSDANYASAASAAFDYLDGLGAEKSQVLSAYLLRYPHRSRDRFLGLPPKLRPLAVRSALEKGSIDVLQDMLKTRSYTKASEAQILNEAKALIKADLAASVSSGGVAGPRDGRAILLLASVDEGRWLKDFELQAWVDALSPERRKDLERHLGELMTGIERGAGISPSKSDFMPLGRVIAALNSTDGQGRKPSSTAEALALAGRYLDLLEEKYGVKKPALPRLSKTALGESCRTVMSRTLSGLMTLGVPMAVGVGVSSGFSYLEASRKAEVRQALQSLCEGEGGSYLRPSDTGPGGCRCVTGGSERDITWTWESLGKRDPQSRICGP